MNHSFHIEEASFYTKFTGNIFNVCKFYQVPFSVCIKMVLFIYFLKSVSMVNDT